MSDLPAILCVDDEENVLNGLRRILFDKFDVTVATSGDEALQKMEKQEFAAIMSDMRMPGMNGAAFLSKARKLAPNTTRLLLTGQADIESAVSAINNGSIFRFLVKPCPEEFLIANLQESVELHRLIKAEKDLLENTLRGAVKVLTETLSTIAPAAFSRCVHIKLYVSHMARLSGLHNIWEYEIAAMLSQVGAIILPPELLQKAFSAIPLDDVEKKMFASAPSAGAKLVEKIPRLEKAALMIESQNGTDTDLATLSGRVLTGARMLRIANVVDRIVVNEGASVKAAVEIVEDIYSHKDDVAFLKILSSYEYSDSESVLKEVGVKQLLPGMILNQDVLSKNGGTVLLKGQEISVPLLSRLLNFAQGTGIQEPIRVLTKK